MPIEAPSMTVKRVTTQRLYKLPESQTTAPIAATTTSADDVMDDAAGGRSWR